MPAGVPPSPVGDGVAAGVAPGVAPVAGVAAGVGIADAVGAAVTAGGFAAMTGSMRRVCAELGVPMGLVLEGGYSLDALAESMAAVMPVLVAPDPPPGGDAGLDVHPLAAEAGRRLERYFGSIFRA